MNFAKLILMAEDKVWKNKMKNHLVKAMTLNMKGKHLKYHSNEQENILIKTKE